MMVVVSHPPLQGYVTRKGLCIGGGMEEAHETFRKIQE